mgnify:CR=1 FL=1
MFQDQYIQFVLGVPGDVGATYGFGESTRHTQKLVYNSTYTLWNTDQAASNFDQSLYGSHPFYGSAVWVIRTKKGPAGYWPGQAVEVEIKKAPLNEIKEIFFSLFFSILSLSNTFFILIFEKW